MSFKEDELIINRGRNGILMDERMAGGGNVAYFERRHRRPRVMRRPGNGCCCYPEWHTAAGASEQAFIVTQILEGIYRSGETEQRSG